MNREEMLKISLPSWLNFKEVSEVVIVDWSSNSDLSWVTYDKRVKYVRVFGEDYFSISNAYNIALKLATNDLLLKLDVDVILNPFFNFFEKYKPKENEFYRGVWNNYNIIRHHYHSFLVGSFFIHRKNIEEFNPLQEGYGFDDMELYAKLKGKGLIELPFEDDFTILHTPHSDYKRSENYKMKEIEAGSLLNRRQIQRKQRLGIIDIPEYTIKKIGNIYVARQS